MSRIDKSLVWNVLSALPTPREARVFIGRRPTPTLVVSMTDNGQSASVISSIKHSTHTTNYDNASIQAKATTKYTTNAISRQLANTKATLDELALPNAMHSLMRLGLAPVVVVHGRAIAAFAHARALEAVGARARPLVRGVFGVNRLESVDTSATTEMDSTVISEMDSTATAEMDSAVTRMDENTTITTDITHIESALASGTIPVIACVGESREGSVTTIATHVAAAALARALLPSKFIVFNAHGGIVSSGRGAGFVNLSEHEDIMGMDRDSDLNNDLLADKDTSLGTNTNKLGRTTTRHTGTPTHPDPISNVALIASILNILPPSASAVLTRPDASPALIAHLVTNKPFATSPLPIPLPRTMYPPPTLFRRGLPVHVHASLENVNVTKLTALLEASFQKHLLADAYYNRISEAPFRILIAGDYDGAVIVTMEKCPNTHAPILPYMDKFAVAPSSQGLGVADILWTRLVAEYPDLSWRSRADNPVNKWYFEHSDGNVILEGGKWMLFWYGPNGLGSMDGYKRMANDIPASFVAALPSS